MKTFIATIVIIFVGMATAYAGNWMLLHVGVADGSGGGGCSNSLDFSQACNSQYLL